MVVRANKYDANIGGHLATYASLATMLEVGYNHFFRGSYPGPDGTKLPGDFVYFQGHASPGVYGRAYLEGRLSEKHLENFRHELRDHPGLSSYPHPWLMPNFWQFPTVSMGLGPIAAIYQARFMRYLENRGIIPETGRKVWAFLGDGETDEPESLGATTLASRERLDNLIFVVNCNLQRLDGPVRGNGHIIQELEAAFLGAGWNVIKVVWGAGWDDLLARDSSGLLIKRMHECVDGEYQTFRAHDGAYLRKEFFGKYPELLKLVEHMSDDELWNLRRGGLDPDQSVQRLPARHDDPGPAHGDSGQDREGLRAGRSRRRPDDRAPAEEAQRRRPDEDSGPLRSASHRRELRARRFPPSGGRFSGDEVSAGPAGSAGRQPARAQSQADRDQGAAARSVPRCHWAARATARRPPRLRSSAS